MKFTHNKKDDYGDDTQYWNEINQQVAEIYNYDFDIDDYENGEVLADAFVVQSGWFDDLDDEMKDDLYVAVAKNF